jgi:DNA-binding MarR family transcriptional regulator
MELDIIKIAYLKFKRINELYAKSNGTNFETVLVLHILYGSEKIYNQTDICDELDLSKQIVNAVIKSLWKQGYVSLSELKDRRYKSVMLTDEGKIYASKLLKPYSDLDYALATEFSTEQVKILATGFNKCVDVFERILQS